jgi:hypothetical protein
MTQLIARIVLDTENWEPDFPASGDRAVVWHRMQIAFARPFTPQELASGGLLGDQYFD